MKCKIRHLETQPEAIAIDCTTNLFTHRSINDSTSQSIESGCVSPRKENMSPKQGPTLKGNSIFQPSILRGHSSDFREENGLQQRQYVTQIGWNCCEAACHEATPPDIPSMRILLPRGVQAKHLKVLIFWPSTFRENEQLVHLKITQLWKGKPFEPNLYDFGYHVNFPWCNIDQKTATPISVV